MKPKYKVGDVIQIKSTKFFKTHPDANQHGIVSCESRFTNIMYQFCGKKYIINEVDDFFATRGYYIYGLRPLNKKTTINYSLPPTSIANYKFNEWMFENMIKKRLKLL